MKRAPRKRTTTRKPDLNTPSVHEDIVELERLRSEKSDLEGQIKTVQSRLTAQFIAAKQSKHSFEANGKRYSATNVEGEIVTLDSEKLRKKIGVALWNKISTRALDQKKLEAYVSSGEITTSTLASCSESQPKNPYIKITVKTAE